MNTRNIFHTTAILALFTSGCVTNRTVEITAARVEVANLETSGITSSAAVDIFQSVAGQLTLPVTGPQEPAKDLVEYLAHTAGSRVTLVMWVEPKRIRFDAGVYGSSKEFAAAHEASVLFERALKDRGIPYTITNVTAIPPP